MKNMLDILIFIIWFLRNLKYVFRPSVDNTDTFGDWLLLVVTVEDGPVG